MPQQEYQSVDIFISYSRKDKVKADKLSALLTREGWEVWKDDRIHAGKEYEVEIIEALNHSKALVVLWSNSSAKSEWVRREAGTAMEQRKLIPVQIEECKIPLLFSKIETTILTDWKGEKEHSELTVLYNGITDLVIPTKLENVRKGFNPYFLNKNQKIVLPEVKGAADLIHYANFSIVMNPVRRMAWYVAYNIDGTRYHEGLERNDRWMPDPSWPVSLQPSNAHFIRSGWHRGHLLSPNTVCWGEKSFAGIARRQANYWTNTTPQSDQMNIKWWFSLEQFERSIAKIRKKVSGFSGPVFTDQDESFRDEFVKDGMFTAKETYKIPKAYWKLIISKKGRKTEYVAFILDQSNLEKVSEKNKFSIADYIYTVADLETRTGLIFSDYIRSLPLMENISL
jgi:DNA/RNA endonuclease G (NUC1)